MNFLDNFNIYVQALIVASTIIGFIFLTNIIIYSLKLNIKAKAIRYIYSYSSGFLLITAIVGQLVTAQTNLTVHWKIVNISNGLDGTIASGLQNIISIFIIIGGFIAGILLSYCIKKIYQKIHHKGNEYHHEEDGHSHSYVLESKYEHEQHHNHSQLQSIMMIVSHRIPAGIAMGSLIYTSSILSNEGVRTYGLAMSSLIAFAIHLIPESLLLYFTRVHMGESRLKAALITSGSLLIFIPLLLIGILFGQISALHDSLFWIQPFIYVIIASILIWEVISELIPEFIHAKQNPKDLLNMLIVFMAGVASSGVVQMIHFH